MSKWRTRIVVSYANQTLASILNSRFMTNVFASTLPRFTLDIYTPSIEDRISFGLGLASSVPERMRYIFVPVCIRAIGNGNDNDKWPP